MNNQHIIKAHYPKKDTIVYLFYEVKSGKLSGHFFMNNVLSKEKTLKIISDTFPPTFDEIGEYKIKLMHSINYLYLKPEESNHTDYSFFKKLISL